MVFLLPYLNHWWSGNNQLVQLDQLPGIPSALGTPTQQLPAYFKIQCLGGNRKSSSLLFAAVPCYTSLQHTLNQGSWISVAQMVSWSSISCLELTCNSFSMPILLRSHGMKGSGSLSKRKENYLEEENQADPVSLKRFKRQEGGQSRTASFQAAGQQIHPGTAPAGVSSGCPLIGTDNCTLNKWD